MGVKRGLSPCQNRVDNRIVIVVLALQGVKITQLVVNEWAISQIQFLHVNFSAYAEKGGIAERGTRSGFIVRDCPTIRETRVPI